MDGQLIHHCALFYGIEPPDMASMLQCLSPHTVQYRKGDIIYHAGDTTTMVGAVMDGCVHIIKEDFWGNRSILAEISAGQLFGETYAAAPTVPLEVSVVAAVACSILFLDTKRIMNVCANACTFHTQLIRNLLAVTAQKNLLLTRKLEYMALRSTRQKLLAYLSAESQRQKSPAFEIPFNRQQLADYLAVDRSAMSKELCKLRDESILIFEKNHFQLLS